MSGIKRSCNRPKLASHLRSPSSDKKFGDTTKEEREASHRATDAWAERERAKEPDRVANAKAARAARRQQEGT